MKLWRFDLLIFCSRQHPNEPNHVLSRGKHLHIEARMPSASTFYYNQMKLQYNQMKLQDFIEDGWIQSFRSKYFLSDPLLVHITALNGLTTTDWKYITIQSLWNIYRIMSKSNKHKTFIWEDIETKFSTIEVNPLNTDIGW